jgi:hypothetical protein
MSLFVSPLASLAVVAVFAIYAGWRSLKARRRVTVGHLACVSLVVQAALAFPVGWFAGMVHRWAAPIDDWHDVIAAGTVIVQLISLPVVVGLTWLIGTRFERARCMAQPCACTSCGYDLVGSTCSKCPECGKETSA